ncbi:peptidase inhibitor family I36 protein [Promicromonospora sukumoe]|uniref:peptidase inhibitor family I36 protein n=1 Tax=Promicromonospora sukumoe TaxID=88382 RepID=UPI0009FD0697|nr:peptidase inhibitor family I36 protein [Promicromonospora sukumoe]
MTLQKRWFVRLLAALSSLLCVVGGAQAAQAHDDRDLTAPHGNHVTDASTGEMTPAVRASASTTQTAGTVNAAAATSRGVADWNDCTPGKICVWTLTNANGSRAELGAVSPGSCAPLASARKSVWNRTSVTQRLWTNSNCTGISRVVEPGILIGNTFVSHNSVGGYP